MPFSPAEFRLAETIAEAAAGLRPGDGPQAIMSAAVHLAQDVVPEADHAGVALVHQPQDVRTTAWTSDAVRAADAHYAGPGAAAHWSGLWTAPLAVLDDTSAADGDGAALVGLGLRSMLSLRLSARGRALTVLTLYAGKPRAFGEPAVRLGRLLCAHISLALESAVVQEQLTEAMHTRDIIGQATGILMARLDMDAAQAFDRLVRASQKENVKLRDIAVRIVQAARAE
ncbi:GAF and ANTAR domain-containing protein [Streptomyces sp. NPDC001941]|uniref:GAF and ANTAR domain-containing protein n=1 Tax=Streptomyces sp. NPDC001941 TaxID=3154659 RepID=UPI00331FB854